MSSPIVAVLHHPADVSPEVLDELRARLTGLPRSVELVNIPYKEKLEVRSLRARGGSTDALARPAPAPGPEVQAVWKRAEVLLALDLPAECLDAIPNLRWVQAYSSGVEHLDPEALTARRVALSSAAGVGAVPIAEFVIARLLEVWKQTRGLEEGQRARSLRRPSSRLLTGSTIGIVGLGAIGRAVGERAHALGMRVLATRAHPERDDRPAWLDALHGPDGLARVLSASDAVVLCAPETPETRDLIGAEALRAMRPGAVLCNVARGSLVDEAALVAALSSGRLGAAVLDVTRTEPLPDDDPLWEAPNLYLSPHCAVSPEAYDERLLELFADNLARYARGEPLRNLVSSSA